MQPFYHRTIRTYMVDNMMSGIPMLVASVDEWYECFTFDHECGGSIPAEEEEVIYNMTHTSIYEVMCS